MTEELKIPHLEGEKEIGKEAKRGRVLSGNTIECIVPCGKLYITANHKNGVIREIFLNIGKGGCMSSHLKAMAVFYSLYLSSGGNVDKIIKKTEHMICDLATRDTPGCFKQIAEFLKEVQTNLCTPK